MDFMQLCSYLAAQPTSDWTRCQEEVQALKQHLHCPGNPAPLTAQDLDVLVKSAATCSCRPVTSHEVKPAHQTDGC